MTNILFITSTRIGDAILSMGLVDHILKSYQDPRLTIVCGGLPSSLFMGVPHLDELIVLKKQKYHGHWWWLWKKTIGKKWDVIVDLRDSIISRALPAHEIYRFGKHIDRTAHKVIQNTKVMKLDYIPAPRLFLSDDQIAFANRIMQKDNRAIIGVGPTANWIGKTWPIDRFIDIIAHLTSDTGAFPNARVAVFAAPGEEESAIKLFNTIPPERRIDVIAKGNPAEAAACLAQCDFYIGNDSGLMHAAAAAGVKTCGLFGASYVHVYGPYGAHTCYAHTPETFDELTNFEGYDPQRLTRSLMTSLSIETVLATIQKFLNRQ
jgi:heptosyltransferase-3